MQSQQMDGRHFQFGRNSNKLADLAGASEDIEWRKEWLRLTKPEVSLSEYYSL